MWSLVDNLQNGNGNSGPFASGDCYAHQPGSCMSGVSKRCGPEAKFCPLPVL